MNTKKEEVESVITKCFTWEKRKCSTNVEHKSCNRLGGSESGGKRDEQIHFWIKEAIWNRKTDPLPPMIQCSMFPLTDPLPPMIQCPVYLSIHRSPSPYDSVFSVYFL